METEVQTITVVQTAQIQVTETKAMDTQTEFQPDKWSLHNESFNGFRAPLSLLLPPPPKKKIMKRNSKPTDEEKKPTMLFNIKETNLLPMSRKSSSTSSSTNNNSCKWQPLPRQVFSKIKGYINKKRIIGVFSTTPYNY